MPHPELSTLRYPNLWQGCVEALCPSQSGATGYRLFDDSGNNNHGTLTGMGPGTDWVPSGGKLALDFDGVNDQVNLTNDIVLNSKSFSISFWAAQVGSSSAAMPLGNRNTTNSYLWFRSANYLRVAFPVGTVEFTSITAFTELSHYVVTGSVSSAGLSSIGLSVNGKAQTPQIIADSSFTLNTIGAGYSGAFWFPGQIDDVRLYNRALAPYEIWQLASSRGAAYERITYLSKASAASTNRRRRILCGANC